jgi:hypothetical protein
MSKENRINMFGNIRINALIASAVITAVIVSGCWNPFSPKTDPLPPPVQYHNPVDSAYKVLENLEYAYISRDIGHYLDCFRDDFEFHLLEIDWFDVDGDGTIDEYWGLDMYYYRSYARWNVAVPLDRRFHRTGAAAGSYL